MKLLAVDLGGDIQIEKAAKEFKMRSPTSWEEPMILLFSGKKFFIYSFGALVGVEVNNEELMYMAKQFSRFVEGYSPSEIEELSLTVDKKSKDESVFTDELNESAIMVASFALAQSVSLSRMEKVMDRLEEEVEKVLFEGRFSGRRALQVAKNLMKARHELISDIMILEKPSLAWEEEWLDQLYSRVYNYLELGRRYRVMEKRLESSFETIQVLLSFSSESRGNFLEFLIVILIIVEILLWVYELLL